MNSPLSDFKSRNVTRTADNDLKTNGDLTQRVTVMSGGAALAQSSDFTEPLQVSSFSTSRSVLKSSLAYINLSDVPCDASFRIPGCKK